MEFILKKSLFGKEVEFIIYDVDEKLARDIVEEAYLEGLRLEKIFNFYDEESSLALLNKKRSMDVPDELLEVLEIALKLSQETKGRYDISLGKQFIARKKGHIVENLKCSYKDIVIKGRNVELKNEDLLVDLGSIAKGWIADRLAEFLMEKGITSGVINARGDIRIFGPAKEIEIQHPRDSDGIIGKVLVDRSIATSGDYRQFDGTYDRPHIINSKQWISVTTMAETLAEADAYATAIFVSSEDEIRAMLKYKNVKALAMDRDLNIKNFNGFRIKNEN